MEAFLGELLLEDLDGYQLEVGGQVPGQGWAQIVAFLGTYELFINKPVTGDHLGSAVKSGPCLGGLLIAS